MRRAVRLGSGGIAGWPVSKPVRAKAGLPWPVTGFYLCDKCHTQMAGQAGTIATRCSVVRGVHQRQCNGAYFVLVEPGIPDENTVPHR